MAKAKSAAKFCFWDVLALPKATPQDFIEKYRHKRNLQAWLKNRSDKGFMGFKAFLALFCNLKGNQT